jgi:hypothetical protein
MKREHSDGARHVILPETGTTAQVNFEEDNHRWFAQEVAPLLRKWGEFRVIFVGQVPLYAMLTTPEQNGQWGWVKCKPYSLKVLRCVVLRYLSIENLCVSSEILKANPNLSADDISSSIEAEPDVLEHAMSELQDFAKANLTELSKMDKRSTGSASSIDIFCRMDVGVIQTEEGLDYFVNEVEKGPNVCLWAGSLWPDLVGQVGARLGPLLHSWVRENIVE